MYGQTRVGQTETRSSPTIRIRLFAPLLITRAQKSYSIRRRSGHLTFGWLIVPPNAGEKRKRVGRGTVVRIQENQRNGWGGRQKAKKYFYARISPGFVHGLCGDRSVSRTATERSPERTIASLTCFEQKIRGQNSGDRVGPLNSCNMRHFDFILFPCRLTSRKITCNFPFRSYTGR